MKPINLLRAPTAQEQRSVTLWYRITVSSFAAVIALLSLLSWHEYRHLTHVDGEWQLWKNKVADSAATIQTYTTLQQQEKELRSQRAFINNCAHEQKKVASYLRTLAEQKSLLTNASLNNNTAELCVECGHTNDAQNIVSSLKKTKQFDTVRIGSLQQGSQNGVVVTVRATLAPSTTLRTGDKKA